jgi:VIT1/CCC1 family predicted Fe2+/Mn2+ transporter
VPFALFTLATTRLVSLSVTLVLLVLLGVGRSMIGRRRLLPTVAETIGIAAAAAFAGLAIGELIS